MKIKRAILMLTIVSLLVAITAFGAKPPKGEPGVPTKPTVDILSLPDIVIDWETGTATSAVKWSVDIEGTVSFDDGPDLDGDGDGENEDPEVLDFEVSFGTSDRTDDRPMIETDLTITVEQLADAVEEALGLTVDLLLVTASGTGCTAKVKGLNPGKGTQQNNDFSDPSEPFDL